MTPPDTPDPDRPFHWLGGHVDGELDAVTRRRVAEWVESDPRAAEALRDQEQLSPGNAEFWAAVEPPAPTAAAWAAVRDAIARRCGPAEPRRAPAGRVTWAAVAVGVALAVFVAWLVFPRPAVPEPGIPAVPEVAETAPPPRPAADDPLAGYAVLPMPRPGEVLIESVRGRSAPWVIGPEQPVPDVLSLAGAADVDLEAVRPAAADGMMPDPQTAAGPPMIYAAQPR